MTRRGFLRLSLVYPFLFSFSGCGSGSGIFAEKNQLPQADFYLNSNDDIAGTVQKIIRAVSDNPDRSYRVRIADDQNLVFQIVKPSSSQGLANYPYLRLTSEKIEGIKSTNFLWGLDANGLSIVLKDDTGKEITRQPIFNRNRRTEDWLVLGAKAAALGFVFWIAAGITKILAAAIGFIAFNVMIIGLLLAAGTIVVEIFRRLGIDLNWQSFRQLIERSAEFFRELLRQVTDLIK